MFLVVQSGKNKNVKEPFSYKLPMKPTIPTLKEKNLFKETDVLICCAPFFIEHLLCANSKLDAFHVPCDILLKLWGTAIPSLQMRGQITCPQMWLLSCSCSLKPRYNSKAFGNWVYNFWLARSDGSRGRTREGSVRYVASHTSRPFPCPRRPVGARCRAVSGRLPRSWGRVPLHTARFSFPRHPR